MADTYYSVIRGENLAFQVTTGSSTSSEAIELRVLDGTGIGKQELLNQINAIVMYITENDAPA